MKTLKPAACLLLCVWLSVLTVLPTDADEHTVYEWYFQKNAEHRRPELDRNLSFVSDYDCFYLSPDKDEKVIYLTFDAGYENGNVSKILDALDRHGAKGNFFILENLIRRAPDVVIRMEKEGHLVCNHTARHPDMSAITDRAAFDRQLTDLEKEYTALTGKELARFYRPPQGRFTKENLKYAEKLGYSTVFWSFAYADWDNARQPDPQKSLANILDHTHPGMILLLHPTSAVNAAIMDELLSGMEAQGYRFALLEELKK